MYISSNNPSDQYVPVVNGKTGHDCHGAGLGGTYTYSEIRNKIGQSGWISKYDTLTQTPWLFNKK